MSEICCIFAAEMKYLGFYIMVIVCSLAFAATITLEVLQMRLLRVIADKETPAIVMSDGSSIDHAEQRADNQVTIMFNYE